MQKYLINCEKSVHINKISIQGSFQIELEAADEMDAQQKAFNILEEVFGKEETSSLYHMGRIGFQQGRRPFVFGGLRQHYRLRS